MARSRPRGASAEREAGSRAAALAASPQGLVLVVVSTLLAQGLSIYTYADVRIDEGFYPITFAARLLVPLVVGVGLLRLSPGEMGLARPRLSRAEWAMFCAVLLALPLVAVPLLELDAYQASYAVRRGATPQLADALRSFTEFTVSTTLPWEILHRAFLLHAARLVLRRNGLPLAAAAATAIVLTQSFEVLFHFVKPPMEAVAMALGSPVLSWLAFRTRSVLVPVLLHLEVEVLFFLLVLR